MKNESIFVNREETRLAPPFRYLVLYLFISKFRIDLVALLHKPKDLCQKKMNLVSFIVISLKYRDFIMICILDRSGRRSS